VLKERIRNWANPKEGQSTRSLLDRYLAARRSLSPVQRVEYSREMAARHAERNGPPGP
jgi:hypothetical protein